MNSYFSMSCGDSTFRTSSLDGDNSDNTIVRGNYIGIGMLYIGVILSFSIVVCFVMIEHRGLVYLEILVSSWYLNKYGVFLYEILDDILEFHAVCCFMSFDFMKVTKITLIVPRWLLLWFLVVFKVKKCYQI